MTNRWARTGKSPSLLVKRAANGWRFTCAAKRSGAASGGSACWAAFPNTLGFVVVRQTICGDGICPLRYKKPKPIGLQNLERLAVHGFVIRFLSKSPGPL